jgi:polysaccharide pyruvyl transferase WcaK-like protein
MSRLASVETVVATRFHNVLVALTCARPTLAIAYGGKHHALMAQMGMDEFCQNIRELDLARLQEQFTNLRTDAERIRGALAAQAAAHRDRLREQFADLNAMVFSVSMPRAEHGGSS